MAASLKGWTPEMRATWEYVLAHPEGVTAADLMRDLGFLRETARTRLEALYTQRFLRRVVAQYRGPTVFYPESSPPDPPAASLHGPHYTPPGAAVKAAPIATPSRVASAPPSTPRPLKCWVPSCANWKWGETNYCYDHASLAPDQQRADDVNHESPPVAVQGVGETPKPVGVMIRKAKQPPHDAKLLGEEPRCKIDGCNLPERSARGYCEAHERRYGPIAW